MKLNAHSTYFKCCAIRLRPQMIAPLSLHKATERREALLSQRDRILENLSAASKKNPSKICCDEVVRITEEVKKINEIIEKKKEELTQKKRCNCLDTKLIKLGTYATLTIKILIFIASATFSIYDFSTTDDDTNKKRDLGLLILSILVLFLDTIVYGSIKTISDDNGKYKLLTRIAEIEQRTEKNFQKFLKAFNAFKESQEEGQEEQKRKLSHCIHRLNRLPKDRLHAPSREQWILSMLELLPDPHPVKKNFRKLKKSTHKILEHKLDKMPEKRVHWIELTEESSSSSEVVNSSSSPTFASTVSGKRTHL